MAESPTSSTTYRDAGVDIEAGDALVDRIKPAVKRSMRREVLGGIGGFGALVEVPLDRYKKPVMVSGTDGVGTKLRLAIETGRHDTIGIDLVAMCVNDVVVQGAEPLFFLDYYATGKLDVDTAERVIKGIVEGCLQAGCALVGGETAEMPGMYEGEDYDLAGFCVGLVEKDQIIDGTRTRAGDAIIGLASSGAHSNGYSLIRRLLALSGAGPATQIDGKPLYDLLLEPTRIYVKSVLQLLQQSVPVHNIAHITGGGPTGNIPRVMPAGLEAVIDAAAVAATRRVRLAAARGQRRARRDVSHLQLRAGHDDLRARRRGRSRARNPARLRRDGSRDRRSPFRQPRGRHRRMTAPTPLLRVVVLVSGRGSNLKAIAARADAGELPVAHRGRRQRPRGRRRARLGAVDGASRRPCCRPATFPIARPTAAHSATSSSATRRNWSCWPVSCAS